MANLIKRILKRGGDDKFAAERKLLKSSALFDADWYMANHPDIAQAGVEPLTHFIEFGGLEGRSPSAYFDSAWYLATYADVAEAKINPLLHFLGSGHLENRLPLPPESLAAVTDTTVYTGLNLDLTNIDITHNRDASLDLIKDSELFDANWYVATYPDVAEAGVDPAAHFLAFGHSERRSPGPAFDSGWYLDAYPDVLADGINPLLHYLRKGKAEGRAPIMPLKATTPGKAQKSTLSVEERLGLDTELVAKSDLFDAAWYLRTYPGVARGGFDPAFHYTRIGGFEGNNPSPKFDSDYYIDLVARLKRGRADLRKNKINPLVHYLRNGRDLGLKTLAVLAFDATEPNISFNPADVVRTGESDRPKEGQSQLLIAGRPVGSVESDASKAAAAVALAPFATTVAAFCCLSGYSAEDVRYRYLGRKSPVSGVIGHTMDLANLRTLALSETTGDITDAWLSGRETLFMRFEPSNANRHGVVRAYQFDVLDKATLQAVCDEAELGEGPTIITATLINPFMPVLVTVTNENGHLLDTALLPFPALCRGGLYYGELAFFGLAPSAFARLKLYSDSLMHEFLRTDAASFSIGNLVVQADGADGTEPIFSTAWLKWVGHVHKIKPRLQLPGDSADPAVKGYLEGIFDSGTTKDAGVDARRVTGKLTLTLPAQALPTLSALVLRRLDDKAGWASTRVGAFVVCDRTGRPHCAVTLPEMPKVPGEAATPIPYLTANEQSSLAGPAAPATRTPMALFFGNKAVHKAPDALALDTKVRAIVNYRTADDVAAFASALATQDIAASVVKVDYVHNGPGQPLSEADLPEAIKPQADAGDEAPFILICDASIIMTSPHTLATLCRMAQDPSVATAGCLIVETAGAYERTYGGYTPSHVSLTGAPNLVFRHIDNLSAIPEFTYPVIGNSFRLAVIRSDVWQALGGIDSGRFPGIDGDLDFCLRAVKAGYRHLCTSTLRAHVLQDTRTYDIVDAVSQDFLPVMRWQDALEASTLIQDLV